MKKYHKNQNLEKIRELEILCKRTQADFENYKKRTENMQAEVLNYAKADFMAKITPVLDNFHRAFEHAPAHQPNPQGVTGGPDDDFATGIKQIEKQLEDILILEGLQKIPANAGDKFDHNLHEAISCEPNKDIEADHIIAQIESGWKYNDRLIKPAKVRVSKGK